MARILTLLCTILFAQTTLAEVKILTSIKPLQLIASAITGEQNQAQQLLPASASPHSFTLRPSDRQKLAQADLFYWIGPDLENFLTDLAAQYPDSSLAIQQLPNLHLLHYGDSHQHNNLPARHDHAHRPNALDAHLWLSPSNAEIIAHKIADDLIRLDTDNAVRYRENLARFQQELQQLSAELQQSLASVQSQSYFVLHDALKYFEHFYGLSNGGVLTVNSETQPGARQVQQMRQQLEQAGPSCIFIEAGVSPKLAQSLAKQLPVSIREIDLMGHQAQSYQQLQQQLASEIQACLQVL